MQTAESPVSVEAPAALRLNLGCGGTPLDGYVNIDRAHGQEAYPLSYADGSVDEVRASHLFEHFAFADSINVLKDWVRVLKPGGVLRIAVPDLKAWAKMILEGDTTPEGLPLLSVLYGGQVDANDFHKSGMTHEVLMSLMRQCGLIGVQRWSNPPGVRDCASLSVSLNLEGIKPPVIKERLGDIVKAVMTTGRLGFMDNRYCSLNALAGLGISEDIAIGAYFDQLIERQIEAAVDWGYRYVLTMDYDTVFDRNTVERLLVLAESHPEADAIAPLQVKREEDFMLACIDGEVTDETLEPDLTPARAAHFGLTLIRCDAIKDMPHPWFHHIPGPDGRWGDGRCDADMAFWKKFKEHGKRLFIATHIPIGHMQLMVSWPSDKHLQIHQRVSDWRKNGPPPNVRC